MVEVFRLKLSVNASFVLYLGIASYCTHAVCITCSFTLFLFQKNDMENRKAVLDLKDVPPPPPHHICSSQPSQSFSLASLSLLPPCLPHAQITQDSHRQPLISMSMPQPQQQEGASPKVSSCMQCDHCRRDRYGLLGAGGGIGRVPIEVPSSLGLHSLSRSGSCSITSSVYCQHNLSHRSEGVLDSLFSHTCKPQSLSTVATSQPILSHPHHPCCSGPLHAYPSAPLPSSKSSAFPSSTTLAPPLPHISPLSAPLHGSCLDSLNYSPCGVDFCPAARRPERNTHGYSLATANTTAHFCSNPLHLNVENTGCLKGTHFCRECMLKVG